MNEWCEIETFKSKLTVALWQLRRQLLHVNFWLMENILVRKFSFKNAKCGAENKTILEKFRGKIKILSTLDLHRKFVNVTFCWKFAVLVKKLQLYDYILFFNRGHHWVVRQRLEYKKGCTHSSGGYSSGFQRSSQ